MIQEMFPEPSREPHELFEERPLALHEFEENFHGYLCRVLNFRRLQFPDETPPQLQGLIVCNYSALYLML